MIEEILLGLATSGSGVLPLGEQQLLDMASGYTPLATSLYDLAGEQIDTTYYDYGSVIAPTSDWLNGIWTGLE